MSYFAIERNGNYFDHFVIRDNESGDIGFENYVNLTYNEMKSQENLEDFVIANMDAANAMFPGENQAVLTLIGDDDIFIWSIIMGDIDDEIHYVLVDWKKDGHSYRYES